MKKLLSIMLCSLFSIMCFFPSNAFALSNIDGNVKKEIYDTTKLPQKTFQPSLVDESVNPSFILPGGLSWVAESKITGILIMTCISTSDSYLDSTQTTKQPINLIYAKMRVYGDSSLTDTKEDNEFNSSHAGAGQNYQFGWFTDVEVYGTHKFEKTGYQSWYPETYTT